MFFGGLIIWFSALFIFLQECLIIFTITHITGGCFLFKVVEPKTFYPWRKKKAVSWKIVIWQLLKFILRKWWIKKYCRMLIERICMWRASWPTHNMLNRELHPVVSFIHRMSLINLLGEPRFYTITATLLNYSVQSYGIFHEIEYLPTADG